jgi:hypothetical protein
MAAMDRHLARLENLLGEPIAGKVYWMRGPLLSSTHTFSRSTRKTTDFSESLTLRYASVARVGHIDRSATIAEE